MRLDILLCYAYCINFVSITLRINVSEIIIAIGHSKDFTMHERTCVEDLAFTYHMPF